MTIQSSSSLDEARQTFAQAVENARIAWTAYAVPVETDNRTLVDLASPEAERPFLGWTIQWGGAKQVSLGTRVKRQFGQFILVAKAKEGSGTSDCLALLTHCIPFIEGINSPILTVGVGSVMGDVSGGGLYGVPAHFTFWIDSLVTS